MEFYVIRNIVGAYVGGILGLACVPWELFSGPLLFVKLVGGLAWLESSISNGEKRFCLGKKDELAGVSREP